MMERRAFAWSHGIATVQSFGGMLGPVLLLLPDGRPVAPLHVPPWFAGSGHSADSTLLRELRGEWPCVPFGFDAPRSMPDDWRVSGESFVGADALHGYSSHVHWRFLSALQDGIAMECLYPKDHPIDRLWRRIAPIEGKPALTIELSITARRTCSLPIGLHPIFRLPTSGQARLLPPDFQKGRVFPREVEPEGGILCPNAVFQDLSAIPARDGGKISLSRLPLDSETEELVQLCGVDGDFVLAYPAEGWQVRLSWNRTQFPSLLLWVSNRGRSAPPWNGRHVALGVEPVCAAFDLGPAISNASNPIAAQGVATTCHFNPAHPLVTAYRIEVEPTN